jgi:hypothetical protein
MHYMLCIFGAKLVNTACMHNIIINGSASQPSSCRIYNMYVLNFSMGLIQLHSQLGSHGRKFLPAKI